MSGYIDLAEYQPQSSDSDKIKGQNGFSDIEFLQNQHIVKIKYINKDMKLKYKNKIFK